MQNLAVRCCRECGKQYDTPHKSDCPQRRNPATRSGAPRVLVKMEDLAQDEEIATKDAQSYDLMLELDDDDMQKEVSADCGCMLESTDYTVGFIFCGLHRKQLTQYLEMDRLRKIVVSIHKTASEAELDGEPLTACRLIAALTRPEEIENAIKEASYENRD